MTAATRPAARGPVLVVAQSAPLRELLASRLAADAVADAAADTAADTAVDTAAPAAAAMLLAAPGGVDTLVLALPPRRGSEVEPAAGLARAAAQAGCRHLVLLSSAAVHEPSHHQPGLVDEARIQPLKRGNAVARRWRALEEAVGAALAEGPTRLTVLRPAPVPGVDGYDVVPGLLRGRLALVPAGFDPTVQLLAPADLAEAVRRAVERGADADGGAAPGVYHLAPTAAVPLKKALRAAGVRRLPVPGFLRGLGREAGEIDYLRYPFTIADAAARRELGYRPERPSAAVARELAPDPRRRADPPAAADAAHDDFGLDREYVGRLGKTLFRFLHDAWWRIEHQGLEHVPRRGRVVLTGVHRGHQPWDGVMALHLLRRELGRYPRFLIHPTLVKFPFLAPYMMKCGGIHACRENAEWILEREEILAIFPEGIRGAFRRYGKDVYQLGKFGRDEYVRFALRHRAPIVPFVTVGSAEIFPIYGRLDWGWWKRVSEWPYLPITPTMGTVPLPSKWHTLFLEPFHVEKDYGPEAADDARVVAAIGKDVKGRMQVALDEMVRRRKHVFFGSIFTGEAPILAEEAREA